MIYTFECKGCGLPLSTGAGGVLAKCPKCSSTTPVGDVIRPSCPECFYKTDTPFVPNLTVNCSNCKIPLRIIGDRTFRKKKSRTVLVFGIFILLAFVIPFFYPLKVYKCALPMFLFINTVFAFFISAFLEYFTNPSPKVVLAQSNNVVNINENKDDIPVQEEKLIIPPPIPLYTKFKPDSDEGYTILWLLALFADGSASEAEFNRVKQLASMQIPPVSDSSMMAIMSLYESQDKENILELSKKAIKAMKRKPVKTKQAVLDQMLFIMRSEDGISEKEKRLYDKVSVMLLD